MIEIMLLSENIKHKNMLIFFLFLWPTITKITWVQFLCSAYHQVIFKMNYLLHNLKIRLSHPAINTCIEMTVNTENQICQITQEREKMENKHNITVFLVTQVGKLLSWLSKHWLPLQWIMDTKSRTTLTHPHIQNCPNIRFKIRWSKVTPQDLTPPFLLSSPFPSSGSSHFGIPDSHCPCPLAQLKLLGHTQALQQLFNSS